MMSGDEVGSENESQREICADALVVEIGIGSRKRVCGGQEAKKKTRDDDVRVKAVGWTSRGGVAMGRDHGALEIPGRREVQHHLVVSYHQGLSTLPYTL